MNLIYAYESIGFEYSGIKILMSHIIDYFLNLYTPNCSNLL